MRYLSILIPIILSALFLSANYFAQPPKHLKQKVFIIGLSKTGTTSIGDALALLGYKRIGWKDIRSRHLVHTFINGDQRAVVDQTKYFDAFEDLPWPFVYREMAEMFPDAKFILSLRETEQAWLKSMYRHMDRGIWQPATYFYGSHGVEGHEETILNIYRNHTANVRRYFEDQPDRYAELIVDDGDANWKTLCRIAECPERGVPTISFPRSNTVAHWNEGSFVASLHWLWGWSITRIEEASAEFYYGRNWPFVHWMLEQAWYLISMIELACSNMYFKIAVQSQDPLQTAW